MQSDFMFTSESVTEGHPDKLCDQISDQIVGNFLRQDIGARVVAETAVSTGVVFVAVKYRSNANVNVSEVVREVAREVGYDGNGFSANHCAVMTSLQNSRESATETAAPGELVAQEQATLFGFACKHTPNFMPLPIWLAHKLARALDAARKDNLAFLGPDAKTQVGVEFRNRLPHRIHSVSLLASQRASHSVSPGELSEALFEHVIRPAFSDEPLAPDAKTRISVNPEGPIYEGGPAVHSGLTGRKTAVDTYGEFARHSGAALSGKDPSRIDRVGAYAARHAARNVVAAGLAELCEVQLSYSVGMSAPVSVQVETYGTSTMPEDALSKRINQVFDFRVGSLQRRFGLRERASVHDNWLRRLAVYGHFGRPELDLPWEKEDFVDALR